jgi:MazG family protein
MQAQMAREEGHFNLSEVVAGIYAKIKRRHPHVWGDWEVESSDEVVANWDAIKDAEKAEKEEAIPPSLLDDIPVALPALARSQKIQERVRKVGFDWPQVAGVVDKVHEEIGELQRARTTAEQRAELGDILFALVNWARWLGLDAEAALREANMRFSRRFRLLEALASKRDVELASADLETLEAFWQEAKGLLNRE